MIVSDGSVVSAVLWSHPIAYKNETLELQIVVNYIVFAWGNTILANLSSIQSVLLWPDNFLWTPHILHFRILHF